MVQFAAQPLALLVLVGFPTVVSQPSRSWEEAGEGLCHQCSLVHCCQLGLSRPEADEQVGLRGLGRAVPERMLALKGCWWWGRGHP